MFIILILIIWSVAKNTIIKLVFKLLKMVCICICRKKEEDVFKGDAGDEDELKLKSKDIYKDLDLYSLADLLEKAYKEL